MVTVLPRMIAPAERSRSTTTASYSGRRPACSTVPSSVGMSAVSMMSLTPTGSPCSGPSRVALAPHAVDVAGLLQRALVVDERPGLDARLVGSDPRQAPADHVLGAGAPLAQRGERLRRGERGDVDEIVGFHCGLPPSVAVEHVRQPVDQLRETRRPGASSRTPCVRNGKQPWKMVQSCTYGGAMPFR